MLSLSLGSSSSKKIGPYVLTSKFLGSGAKGNLFFTPSREVLKRKPKALNTNRSKTTNNNNLGKVREGYHERTKEKVAVKIIEKHSRDTNRANLEYEVLQICRHPNVVKVFIGKKSTKRRYSALPFLFSFHLKP